MPFSPFLYFPAPSLSLSFPFFSSLSFLLFSSSLSSTFSLLLTLFVGSGQIRLEDFIILLLRCLTLLLLAAALLRPILKDSSLVGNQRVGMVVAIDDSLSMNHGATTRFETAIEKARKILETASPGDKVSIVFLNEREIGDPKKVPLRAADYDTNKISEILDNAKRAGASTHQSRCHYGLTPAKAP